MDNKKNILVVLTGGTICSSTDKDGHRFADSKNVKIIEYFNENNAFLSENIIFSSLMPLDILSENMTIDTWNTLLNFFKNEVNFESYDGIIVLHGTDTFAFTTSLLALVLSGINIPVITISAHSPLDDTSTNGHRNFKAAAELICNKIKPNVYAVYENSDGNIYLHLGSELLQCGNYSNDFFSKSMVKLSKANTKAEGKAFETDSLLFKKTEKINPDVLPIYPYVGIDYNRYNLDNVKAVIHYAYHAETVCINESESKACSCSAIELLNRCKKKSIPLFITPCSEKSYKYETTKVFLENGGVPLYGMTNEAAYVKALVGCALGLNNEELKNFMNKSVNFEI